MVPDYRIQPNRAGELVVAYGFDLRPLLNRAAEITEAAEQARDAALALRRLREALVLHMRDAAKLLAYGRETVFADWDAIEARLLSLRRALRRQIGADVLGQMVTEAGDILAQITHALSSVSEKVHGTAACFGRHHTNLNQDSADFEPCLEKGRATDGQVLDPDTGKNVTSEDSTLPTLPLYLIGKACPDIHPYAKSKLDTWRELVATAAFLRGMMGISLSAWEEACHVMGAETVATAATAMLQRIGGITSPGGHLRALSAKAALGGFSPGPMIMALLNGAKS